MQSRYFKLTLLILAIVVVIAGGIFAYVKAQQKNTDKKIAAISLEINKQYSEALAKRTDDLSLTADGINLIKGNQVNNAIINLTRATEVDPKYKESWYWLGFAYLKQEQPVPSIAALKEAQKIDPIDPRIYQLLKLAYEQNGDTDSAKKMQEKVNQFSKK